MIQVAIIGLGSFGIRMLEELASYNAELIILDKDEEIIHKYQDKVRDAFTANAMTEAVLNDLIPADVDATIVDVGGDNLETSIMVTNYLHKMGVKHIIVKAESNDHGEILRLVGANQVIFPDQEAAKRITPQLLSKNLFNYMPVSANFVFAEVKTPEKLTGKNLIQADVRRNYGINVVAYRNDEDTEFQMIKAGADFLFAKEQRLLVAGTSDAIEDFNGIELCKETPHNSNAHKLFKGFFPFAKKSI